MKNLAIFKIFKNQIVIFILVKYLNYTIGFLRALLVAKFLGVFYLGVWGVIRLANEYLMFSHLGLPFAVNVEFSKKQAELAYIKKLIGGVLLFIPAIIILLLGAYVANKTFGFIAFEKYSFSKYFPFVLVIVFLTIIQQVFSNFYRVFDNLRIINITEFIIQALPFTVLFIFNGEQLIYALLFTLIISYLTSIFIYWIKLDKELINKLKLEFNYVKVLFKSGIPLLLINYGAYLILIIPKSFVSKQFSVEEMGLFTFAVNISTAFLLGIKAIQWAILPKFIHNYYKLSNLSEILQYKDRLLKLNGTITSISIFVVLSFLPILFYFFDEYKTVFYLCYIMLLGQGVLLQGLPYSSFILSKGKQHKVLIFTGFNAIFNLIYNYLIIKYFGDFSYIGVGIFIAYTIQFFGNYYVFTKETFGKISFKELKDLINPIIITFFLLVLSIIIFNNMIFMYLIIGLFLIINYKTIMEQIKLLLSTLIK